MANTDTDMDFGFVDIRAGRATAAVPLAEKNNYSTVTDLRTRLAAINGAYFTSARLDLMTKNDMIYALRQASDSAGIR